MDNVNELLGGLSYGTAPGHGRRTLDGRGDSKVAWASTSCRRTAQCALSQLHPTETQDTTRTVTRIDP